jgi:hypothetical protein
MLSSVLTLLLLIWSRQMQLEARSCKASSLAQNFTDLICFIFLPSIALELLYVQIDAIMVLTRVSLTDLNLRKLRNGQKGGHGSYSL